MNINFLAKLFNKKLKSRSNKVMFSTVDFVVITACYNVEKYVNQMINSIVNQSLDFKNNIKLILVDDSSTDNTLSVLKRREIKYPFNITVISTTNQGVSNARNEGLKLLEYNKSAVQNLTLDYDSVLTPNTQNTNNY